MVKQQHQLSTAPIAAADFPSLPPLSAEQLAHFWQGKVHAATAVAGGTIVLGAWNTGYRHQRLVWFAEGSSTPVIGQLGRDDLARFDVHADGRRVLVSAGYPPSPVDIYEVRFPEGAAEHRFQTTDGRSVAWAAGDRIAFATGAQVLLLAPTGGAGATLAAAASIKDASLVATRDGSLLVVAHGNHKKPRLTLLEVGDTKLKKVAALEAPIRVLATHDGRVFGTTWAEGYGATRDDQEYFEILVT